MPPPKKMSIAMMALKPKGDSMDPDSDGDSDAGSQDYLDACTDLMDAIKGDDPQAVADALDAAIESRPQ